MSKANPSEINRRRDQKEAECWKTAHEPTLQRFHQCSINTRRGRRRSLQPWSYSLQAHVFTLLWAQEEKMWSLVLTLFLLLWHRIFLPLIPDATTVLCRFLCIKESNLNTTLSFSTKTIWIPCESASAFKKTTLQTFTPRGSFHRTVIELSRGRNIIAPVTDVFKCHPRAPARVVISIPSAVLFCFFFPSLSTGGEEKIVFSSREQLPYQPMLRIKE